MAIEKLSVDIDADSSGFQSALKIVSTTLVDIKSLVACDTLVTCCRRSVVPCRNRPG